MLRRLRFDPMQDGITVGNDWDNVWEVNTWFNGGCNDRHGGARWDNRYGTLTNMVVADWAMAHGSMASMELADETMEHRTMTSMVVSDETIPNGSWTETTHGL